MLAGPSRVRPGPCSSQIRSASRLSQAMHGGVGDEVGRRQDRVEQTGRGEQRGIGDVRPSQIVGGVGVVQPPVQMVELVVELGGEPVRRRDGDAELAQRLDAQLDRLGEAVPVGQAASPAPPSRRRAPWRWRHSPSIVRYSSSASSRRPRLYSAAWRPVCTSISVAVSSGSISRSAAASSAFTSA